MIKSNAMEIKTRFLKPSYNTAMTMMRGSIAMVVRLAKNEPCVAPSSKTKAKTRITSEKSDERFEGPPCGQSLEEVPGKNQEEFRPVSDANDASKEQNDTETLGREVEKNETIKTLSAKAKNRAGRRVSADAVESVMNDPKKARAAKRTLEDRELGRFVAPEKKETSANKIKARILGHRTEGRRDAKKPGYKTNRWSKCLATKLRRMMNR